MKIETQLFLLLSTVALIAFALGKYNPLAASVSMIGLVILSFAIARSFAKTLTRPLQDLIQWNNELSQHNAEEAAALACSTVLAKRTLQRQDKIGELARAFQHRESELQRSVERLKQTTATKERLESELQIGRDIQMNMLTIKPSGFSKHKDLEIFATLKPAREVGGDFYDFYFRRENLSYLFEENRFCFCVGDASGKGVPAALFMAVVKTLLRSQAYTDLSPAKILTHVNEVISADNPTCMFVTLFFGVLNLADGELVFTNAGHNPPYIRRQNGLVEQLNQRHGAALGIIEGLTYKEGKTTLAHGDILITYTDGVTEAMDRENNLFSDERFFDLLKTCKYDSAEEVIHLTVQAIAGFQGEAEQSDDLTMLAIQFLKQPIAPAESGDLAINNEALSSLREQWDKTPKGSA
ncbi:MAG TPA: serine/threonine-protein phosphatase [Leptolyngbyaceae cyanobacterium M33_DOE_097]|nr:serine/threonine-protein phosphatase [Leptolyngbyaceae cyanobacterium M33_DOE_097]